MWDIKNYVWFLPLYLVPARVLKGLEISRAIRMSPVICNEPLSFNLNLC